MFLLLILLIIQLAIYGIRQTSNTNVWDGEVHDANKEVTYHTMQPVQC